MSRSSLRSSTVLAHFGSLRATLAGMILLAAVVAAGEAGGSWFAPGLAVALGLLALNLLVALVVHPAFRRQLPLLMFHLALLALALLVAAGRLTALDGRFELTEGVAFDGNLIDSSAGRWHRNGLSGLAFHHEGFEIDYAPGRQRGATRNRVGWLGSDGKPRVAVIGDHRPLVLDGYRFYTSSNKGFAPVLTWRPLQGDATTGAVHLPAYPVHELRQSREWSLPDGRVVWVLLQFDRAPIDPDAHTRFSLPDAHRIVLRVGAQRAELMAGERLELEGGTLEYVGLRTWMGYRVSSDWTLPWLLAAALLAVIALAWHYTQRFLFVARSGRADPAPAVAARGVADA